MSYSITAKGENKAVALDRLQRKFQEEVLLLQPVHELDAEVALQHAKNLVDVVPNPPVGHEIVISLHGSITVGTEPGQGVTWCSCGASVGVHPIQVA